MAWKVKECEGGKLAGGEARVERTARRRFDAGFLEADGGGGVVVVLLLLCCSGRAGWWWRRPIRGEFHLNCAQGAQPRLKGI